MVMDLLENKNQVAKLSDDARATCNKTRAQVKTWLVEDAPIVYGINTGLGNLKDTALSPDEHKSWNKTIPYPHGVGFGKIADKNVARAAILIRANVLARSYSGVRPELIDRMLDVFNSGVEPVVYELGSTGLSDLAPLAQLAMVVAGFEEAEVILKGEKMKAQKAYELVGLDTTFVLECKEVLSQMNGSTFTQSLTVTTFEALKTLFFSVENEISQWDKGIKESMHDMINYIDGVINFENNITCDNPLLFPNGKSGYEAVMGCNCSNTQIGFVMDLVTSIICDMSKIIFLTRERNAETAMIHGLISQLIIPASADSIPTKGNQEDHVEFSYGAARKANKALKLLARQVLVKL